jgi:hypothetical protein
MQLTVFFDGQFWVGVAEAQRDDGVKVARHLFGPEPTDSEVFAFVLRTLPGLLDAAPSVSPGEAAAPAASNPKRRKREAAAAVRAQGVSSYAQEVLKRDLEARQHARQIVTRQQREDERAYKRQRTVEKAKEKHRGH